MHAPMHLLRLLPLLPLLAACATTDPYLRPGQWQPTGANALNLAAMVVRPADLVRGHGQGSVAGIQSTTPVTALWAGKPNPLTQATVQTAITVVPAASGPSQGAQ